MHLHAYAGNGVYKKRTNAGNVYNAINKLKHKLSVVEMWRFVIHQTLNDMYACSLRIKYVERFGATYEHHANNNR
jgi:hypothetical protein